MNNLHNGRAHRVHRDIKPANILVDRHNELRLSDFGLARDTNGQSQLSTVVAGTNRYFSPEVINGKRQSEKSDVWAFGVVLLELAYGRDSFENTEIITMDSTKIREEFIRRGGYSNEMINFLSQCFEKENSERASVEELLRDIWLENVSIQPTVQSNLIEPSKNN